MHYITVPELSEKLRAQGKTVIEIKPDRAMLGQLLAIPPGGEIMACVPDKWTDAEKERFTLQIHEAMISVEISRNTIKAFQSEWELAAFWNHEAAISAIPVNEINSKFVLSPRPALIIGAGPSIKNFTIPENMISYAAWSAKGYIGQPNFIGHCDHRGQAKQTPPPSSGLIFTPCCSPEFLKAFSPTLKKVVYYDRGNPVCQRFAEKRGTVDHESIVGHVVDMLVQSAIYAGHKVIKLIGVDLSCTTPEELFKYHPHSIEAIPATNYRGEVVYIDEIFQLYQRGLEGLAARYPEIEFSVLSDKGLILEGIPFEQA